MRFEFEFEFSFEFEFEFAPENGLKRNKTTKYGTISKEKRLFIYLLTKITIRKNIPQKIFHSLSQL